MTNKVYADGKGPTYSYTPDGKLSRRTWARGIVTDYSYDNWGSITNTVYSDNTPTVSLAYDVLGRQAEARDAAGTTTFLYDSLGSLTNETVIGIAGTNSIDRFYDNFGRDTGYALNGVRQSTLGYDSATARLLSMQISRTGGSPVQDEATFSWSYLPGSDLKSSLSYPNGLTAFWTYDTKGQLLQVCNAFPTNIVSQYDYTYDAAGSRVSCGKTGSAFAQNDTLTYAYNNRSELTNAVAAVDSDYRYAYDFDDIGNRETSSERGTNSVYAANQLNQYTEISSSALSASPRETFTPQFDDDGNQTRIKTATAILCENVSTNSPAPNSTTPPLLSMSYDRMGRRVTKNNQRFVYNGYLQIANFELQTSNIKLHTFVWDSTEKIATRPLVWNSSTFQPFNFSTSYYVHDGNKNVSDVVADNGDIAAHYEYAPFGAVVAQRDASAASNPWRFSCEYADDELAMLYYNFRHYNVNDGRWLSRDPIGGKSEILFVMNSPMSDNDVRGLKVWNNRKGGGCKFEDIDEEAKRALKDALRKMNSTGQRHEWFGSICCKCVNGRYVTSHTGPFEGKTKIKDRWTKLGRVVDTIEYVPQRAPYAQCPKDTVLVGYYHTHPKRSGRNLSEKDKDLIKNMDIPTYMGYDNEENKIQRADPMRTDDPKTAGLSGNIDKPDGIAMEPEVTTL